MYHGSRKKFDIGFILLPQDEYTSNEVSKDLEELFESVRPDHCIPRKEAVYLSDNVDLIDASGGYTDIIYKVDVDDYEKSDLAWYTEAQTCLENGSLKLAKKCALKYWSGEDYYDNKKSCIEYRANSAIVNSIVEINVIENELEKVTLNNIDSDKSKLEKLIRNKVVLSNLNIEEFKWSIEQNLEYHTVRHKNNLTKDSDIELIFNDIMDSFVEEILKLENIEKNSIKLYRAIALNNINDLNLNLGIYWSFDKDNTSVFDDEGYVHKNKNRSKYKVFEFESEIELSDVDWETTFDLYLIQEFGEYEIRLNSNAKFKNIKFKEDKSLEFKELIIKDKKTNKSKKIKM